MFLYCAEVDVGITAQGVMFASKLYDPMTFS